MSLVRVIELLGLDVEQIEMGARSGREVSAYVMFEVIAVENNRLGRFGGSSFLSATSASSSSLISSRILFPSGDHLKSSMSSLTLVNCWGAPPRRSSSQICVFAFSLRKKETKDTFRPDSTWANWRIVSRM